MKKLLSFSFSLLILFTSCSKSKTAQDTKGFPKDVAAIINTRCAVVGCHTDNTAEAAGGLSLSSWTTMFYPGGSGGSDVIPYRADESWLCYFVNTYKNLGIQLTPTMPVNGTPLTQNEVVLLQQWINKGAPDEAGDIAFTGDPKRNKFYVVNQACSEVTVFDSKTLLAMRYIHVGDQLNKLPHAVMVSPDMQYWYVIFSSGTIIQKFKTSDDSYVGTINLIPPPPYNYDPGTAWNTMTFYNGSHQAFVVDFEGSGKIAYVDLDQLQLLKTYQEQGGVLFSYPHGSAMSPDQKTLYVTSQNSPVLYKINVADPLGPCNQCIQNIKIDISAIQSNPDSFDLHAINFSPDGSKYFISCQKSNMVLEYQTKNDSLLKVFNVGAYPQEMAFSTTKPYLFVTCEEDPNSYYKSKGSVEIINYNTDELLQVKLQNGLFQPHGIAVDDKNSYVIVPSLDWDSGGPAPHHVSTCEGKNGFVEVFDLNNLNRNPINRTEVSVYPYFVSVRN